MAVDVIQAVKGKTEARFAKLVAKFDAWQHGTPESIRAHELDETAPIVHGPALEASERRQFRKLLARSEKLGREWRIRGRQKREDHGKRQFRGQDARRASERRLIRALPTEERHGSEETRKEEQVQPG